MKTPRHGLAIAASVLVIVPLGAIAVVWLGAIASLDRDYPHTQATGALPTPDPSSQGLLRIPAGTLEFRARVAGLGGPRGNLILLHGFATSSAMWEPLVSAAAQAGYQVVAFDQRGYSPGARPTAAHDYRLDALANDVQRVARAVGFATFHLAGHAWGARVGWHLIGAGPANVDSWTALAMPHNAAFNQALAEDPQQQRRSRYWRLLQTPWLPEQVLAFNRFEILRATLWATVRDQHVDEYATILGEPGALRAAINWFRAPIGASIGATAPPHAAQIPTLLIWGNQDPFLAATTIDTHRALTHYSSERAVELELDAGHWLLQTHPKLVATAILNHMAAAANDAPPRLRKPRKAEQAPIRIRTTVSTGAHRGSTSSIDTRGTSAP